MLKCPRISRLFIFSIVCFSAAMRTSAEVSSDVGQATVNSQASNLARNGVPGEPWTYLINDKGPTGIAKVGKNMTLCGDVRLRPNSQKLVALPGNHVVAALSKFEKGQVNNLISKQKFGDCKVQLEFLIGTGSNLGVKLQRRYEIQIYDSHHKEKPSARECGGI